MYAVAGREGSSANLISMSFRLLGQNALERAAMHVEAARGLGDVAAAELVDALDVLPAHPIGRPSDFPADRLYGPRARAAPRPRRSASTGLER